MAPQDVGAARKWCWGDGKGPDSSEQGHVGVGVREHVKRLEWKTGYDESGKLFDENLQNS